MPYETRYGTFIARSRLTASKARALYAAGLRVVLLQVDWQRSKLGQRSIEQLREEQRVAGAAGLEVWWWAWVTPTLRPEAGRRPSGANALGRRLDELVAALGSPAGFVADAEVGGRWTRARLGELPLVAAAARNAGMPIVGLTSHGMLSREWGVGAWDVGLPQFYGGDAIDVDFSRRCLATWDDARTIWICLGCADAASTPEQMRGDLRTIEELGVEPRPGVAWWTARQLRHDNGRLAAAVPR
ncbi:MAG: hypothetical protein JNL82_14565 [Myxococcales bacterium]|nr:hypothetical protein [Myxococcales bacterium]